MTYKTFTLEIIYYKIIEIILEYYSMIIFFIDYLYEFNINI